MNPFFCVIVLLRLSLVIAANFTQVYQWNEFDYEWFTLTSSTKALSNGTIKIENIIPSHMAVHGTRIFFSLFEDQGIPVNLVSLPTSSASTTSPKLTPFPSWSIYDYGICNKINEARGLQVDSVGRLWVLDNGSDNCSAKIWAIDLADKDNTKLIHQFPFRGLLHDMVIDETPNGTFAYIARPYPGHILVFNLERNQSWIVDTPGIKVFSIALTPKEEPRQLYLGKYISNELYSIPVAALRNGTRTINPELIGKWTAKPYKMSMDNHGILYSAFWKRNYLHSWNTSQPFKEQPFYEVRKQDLDTERWPFTFALDSSGNYWMTEHYKTTTKPKYRLLKAAVVAKPIISDFRTTDVVKYSSPDVSTLPSTTVPYIWSPAEEHRLLNIVLICTNVFSVVLFSLVIFWLVLKLKRKNSLSQNTNEAQQMSVLPDEPAEYDDVGPAEVQYEEVKYDQVTARPPFPGLYEPPIRLSPRSARRVKAMPERPRTFEEFGEAPLPPVEYDDVGPPPEPLYDEVKPETSTTLDCEDTTSESAQYLKILP